jgi:cytochrome P450
VTYDDIKDVNRKAELFSSAAGITLGEQPPETLEFCGSMIVMDNPRHAKFRTPVQKGFTPKTVAAIRGVGEGSGQDVGRCSEAEEGCG